jgi:zinc transport system ATP-binding protein
VTALPLRLAEPAPPLVSFRNVSVDRGGRAVLTGITADIPRGGITTLVGLNGSGKSTLLRAMLGELPHRGEIVYRCGHDHSRPRPEYVGYVPQRLAIDARLPITVRDLFGLALNRSRPLIFGIRKSVQKSAAEMLRKVDAAHLLDIPIEGLSGGQMQRVLLALALDPQPELLLLDEPAAGIDFKDEQDFYTLISDLNRNTGVTVVLVSHDISMVTKFASHVLCLQGGIIQSQGHPADVLSAKSIAATFGSMGLNRK